jgi:hypothetical protein
VILVSWGAKFFSEIVESFFAESGDFDVVDGIDESEKGLSAAVGVCEKSRDAIMVLARGYVFWSWFPLLGRGVAGLMSRGGVGL